jgi:hypothetical protein
MLTILVHITLVMAVFIRFVGPLSLIALVSFALVIKIGTISWNGYANETKLLRFTDTPL